MEDYYYKVAVGDGGFPGGSDGKESIFNAGDSGLILGSGRSPGEWNGYPLPVFLPREFHVHGVTKSLHSRHKGIILFEVRLSKVKLSMMLLLFCHQIMSYSLQPHGLKASLTLTRLPWPSPSPKVCPSSCLLNWWHHPTISSSAALFSSIFPSIRVFSNESAVTTGGQIIVASALASVLPMSI